jgi:hypothetical protein
VQALAFMIQKARADLERSHPRSLCSSKVV